MRKGCFGLGSAMVLAVSLTAVESCLAASGDAYVWPGYRTDLDYNTKTVLGGKDLTPPTKFNNNCSGVTGQKAGKWWAFYWGKDRDSRITDVTIDSILKKYDTDFEYLYNTMGWAPDAQAQKGQYSAIYYYGSGTCAGGAKTDTTGGWQTFVAGYTAVAASFYPLYSFNTSCPYRDRVSQMDAMIHEGIHSMTNGYPGAKEAHWFQEAGNTWIQQDMFSHRNAIYSGMGFLNAATLMAPFMPIECYSGWLVDGTFGGPGAQGVTGKNQRNLLGGAQYSNIFPTFIGTWLGTGAVRWIYGNAYGSTKYLLETYGLDKGLGDAGVRRLITEFRAKLAMLDMKEWSNEMKNLINNNFGGNAYEEQYYWDNGQYRNGWTMTPYQTTSVSGDYIIPDEATTPGWSGSNVIPLKVQNGAKQVKVSFYNVGSNSNNTNMNYLLCYRATDGTPVYSEPITGEGSVTLRLDKTPSSTSGTQMVFAVIVNTDYKFTGNENIRTKHFNYKLKLEEGLSGAGSANTRYHNDFVLKYDWNKLPASSSSSTSSSSSSVKPNSSSSSITSSSSSSVSSSSNQQPTSSSSIDIAKATKISLKVSLPIDDNYATAKASFNAAEVAKTLGLTEATLDKATYFAVDKGAINTTSTANAPGHWFAKDGSVTEWANENSYAFSELDLGNSAINVGHYPNRANNGDKVSFQQGLAYNGKAVLFSTDVSLTNEESSDDAGSTTSLMYGIKGLPKHIGLSHNHGILTITYKLERHDNVKISLFNGYGALLGLNVTGLQSAGTHALQLDMNRMGLTAGTYIVKVSTGSYLEARSITINR
ncbi:MAG: DUF4859 domain-containing protein [Fibrobacter sp.]|nr:DUF4859 domain-containing protein [Fibrobacter sp.]